MIVSEAKRLANQRNGRLPGAGRPLGSIEEVSAYRKAFKLYVAKRVEEVKGKLIDSMLKEALEGNIEAFKALLDYSHGKPAQALEVGGTDGQPIVFMPLALIQKHALEVIEGEQVKPQPIETVKDVSPNQG